MQKTIIFLLLILFIFGCQEQKNGEKWTSQLDRLRTENDSLKRLVAEINNKYVFDSISFREIYSPKNTNKLNSEFNVELLVVGYNPEKSFFVKFDSIVDGQKINPDTLKQSNGGFKYKTILKDTENTIRIDMNVGNKFGQKKSGVLYETVRAKN
ncbi:hypothetical protein [Maribacter sp. 2307UL18-2]|uniref:hypothetical protein n=1 Tax=Maribacter sp. 2307UL18-2 TaxID=3386274 RepID=UPI0039BD3E0F